MIAGVIAETLSGERRVAIVPAVVPTFTKAGLQIVLQSGAGAPAGFTDTAYAEKGVTIAPSATEVVSKADVLLRVRLSPPDTEAGRADLSLVRSGQSLVAFLDPLNEPALSRALAEKGVTAFS